jgi:hypothetical protein
MDGSIVHINPIQDKLIVGLDSRHKKGRIFLLTASLQIYPHV